MNRERFAYMLRAFFTHLLRAFFAIVYFYILFRIIDLIFHNAMSAVTDILAMVCIVIAFIGSIVLADLTVKMIQTLYRKE